ncbi:MAG: sulfotransferase family 2 domain-containing protein [bacterium]
MIISHKHKFIFIKPIKVAGTSVELNLAKNCGKKDIITHHSKPSKESDETLYNDYSQNYEGFNPHMPPEKIREKIGEKIWNDYLKITIIRNPWDVVVSKYFWQEKYVDKKIAANTFKAHKIKYHLLNSKAYKHILRLLKKTLLKKAKVVIKKSDFQLFVESLSENNDKFYFDSKCKPAFDFYIRFENLEKDYKKLCQRLGIPFEPLPKTKTKQRKEKKHYSKYYNKKTKKTVEQLFRKQIDYFGYKFEKK